MLQASDSGETPPRKRMVACLPCRDKKMKCTGTLPCERCQRQEEQCFYPEGRKKPTPKRRTETQRLARRLEHFEQQLLRLAQEKGSDQDAAADSELLVPTISQTPTTSPEGHVSVTGDSHLHSAAFARNELLELALSTPTSRGATILSDFSQDAIGNGLRQQSRQIPAPSDPKFAQGTPYPWIATPREYPHLETTSPISTVDKLSYDYPGISLELSICSKAGAQWVAAITGSTAFETVRHTILSNQRQRCGGPRRTPRERTPEPDMATAMIYTQAYFEQSPEAVFGIVDRTSFETQLRRHFNDPSPVHSEDPAWYALRNTVYAAGCRMLLSEVEYSSTFAGAQEPSGNFFENALSVLSELLYPREDLEAVQAVVLMTLYCGGLSSPSIDHTLICTAVRLAQQIELDQSPARRWSSDGSDDVLGCWLFWTIYCLEKRIAYVNGFNSMLDDNAVTCPLPTMSPNSSHAETVFLTYCIQHAKMLSEIMQGWGCKRLFDVSAEKCHHTFQHLDRKLEDWRESLPDFAKVRKRNSRLEVPRDWNPHAVTYLQCAYNAVLMEIHFPLVCPWMSQLLGAEASPATKDQAIHSSALVAEAARNVILTSNTGSINASTPSWQMFHLPTMAAMSLFMHVLKEPSSPSASSDIALLDMLSGHFGYLGHTCGIEAPLSSVREIANIARNAVRKAAGPKQFAGLHGGLG
ncbi:uncharacterized protein PV07_05971 [Cladophialophora immunda]|uniref:Zn(2)-C6 fungal-type domain-containing protein n=1 Tax=Cladophialophora immunda TaxID=569365 RepID=A0A0D2AY33_9EURO|nr:uncharacterized protein PV07_05971 [Cladophialophora immunda]KIW30212.1 hypothetical protein PV07_05971 [Cladophialophora immunda]